MTLTLERWDIHAVHLRYYRPQRWASVAEDGADYVLLTLHTMDGHTGVAEAAVRLTWSGFTVGALRCALDEVLLPRLKGADIADPAVVERTIDRIPENSLAKSLVDAACWDLRAQNAGQPLWQLLGGERRVPVSWTLTRQAPEAMAEEAARVIAEYGFRTFKLKTGQGLETDRRMLTMVREAVGDDVQLYADANSHYAPEDMAAYGALLADAGCVMSEDPCTIMPDEAGRALRTACPVPIMIDKWCRNLFQARVYLNWGAAAVSVKMPKSGISESLSILALADAAGAQAPVGLSANSAFGSLATLSLAATRTAPDNLLPAEESFFVQLRDDYMTEPLRIQGGAVTLPDTPGAAALIDRDKVRAFAVTP